MKDFVEKFEKAESKELEKLLSNSPDGVCFFVGIDPGLDGAIVFNAVSDDFSAYRAFKMPVVEEQAGRGKRRYSSPKKIFDILRCLPPEKTIVVLEQIPFEAPSTKNAKGEYKRGGLANAKLLGNYSELRMACISLGLKHHLAKPRDWAGHFFMRGQLPPMYDQRKNALKREAARQLPAQDVCKWNADAFLLCIYARDNKNFFKQIL